MPANSTTRTVTCYSIPGMGAEYRDKRVCLPVSSVREHISGNSPISTMAVAPVSVYTMYFRFYGVCYICT